MSTIIFINGTSSSGNPAHLDRPLWDDMLGKAHHSGPVGLTLFSDMHHAVAAAASRGNNILADHKA